MTDSQRERIYWLGLVGVAVVSPLVIFGLARSGFSPRFDVNEFIAVLALCMPAVTVLDIALHRITGASGGIRFWVKNPVVEQRFRTPESLDASRNEVARRLKGRGFTVSAGAETTSLRFHKPKTQPTSGFLDSAFSGNVGFVDASDGTDVDVRLEVDDTLVLETGETRVMEALARYLSLETDAFTHREVPFMLYCAAFVAFTSGTFAIATVFRSDVFGEWLTAASVAALSLLAIALGLLLWDREHLEGYRLVLAGAFVAAYPYVSLIF